MKRYLTNNFYAVYSTQKRTGFHYFSSSASKQNISMIRDVKKWVEEDNKGETAIVLNLIKMN